MGIRDDLFSARREELLTAIKLRLRLCAEEEGLSAVLEQGALEEAHELAGLLDEDDTPIRLLLGALHLGRAAGVPESQRDAELETALAMFTPCFIAGTEPQPPAEILAACAQRAAPSAVDLLRKVQSSPDEELVFSAVRLWQRIVDATARDDPTWAASQTYLGIARQAEFFLTGRPGALESAIDAAQAAVDATPPGDPARGAFLGNLGLFRLERFDITGRVSDLDAAIAAMRAALDGAPHGDSNLAALWSSLAAGLRGRAERTGNLADLDAAIDAGRTAVRTGDADDPRRPLFQSNLAAAFQARFAGTGTVADLDAAVSAAQAAVDSSSPDDTTWPRALEAVSRARHARYRRSGDLGDLNAAVDAARTAMDCVAPGRPQDLLGLSNLGVMLLDRFKRAGDTDDLDAAFRALTTAADTAPVLSPYRALCLSNLGTALRTRLEWTGSLADADTAIEAQRAAVQATPTDHPARAGYLSNLAASLLTRFRSVGALADLNAGIEAARTAVAACPPGHPDRPLFLSNLSSALQAKFRRTDALSDLDEAIRASRSAVEALPAGHPDWPKRLSTLAGALLARFGRTEDLAELDAVIQAEQAAIQAAPADDPNQAVYQSILGLALCDRFERTGVAADSDAAIQALTAAVQTSPPDHPSRAEYLCNLGRTYSNRLDQTGAAADRDAAVSSYIQAAGLASATPSTRILGAYAAGVLLAESEPARAADLFEQAVYLIPQTVPRRMHRSDQERQIARLDVANDAAALTLAGTEGAVPTARAAVRALRLLETGRAVLFSQALETRDDLTDLRLHHPDLAERFVALRSRLDQPDPAWPPAAAEADAAAAPGEAAEQRRRLAVQFTRTLADIRAQDGFAFFGLPPAAEDLVAEAAAGPIVTFNVSSYGSDAIVLTTGGATSIRLPRLTGETLAEQINGFRRALDVATAPDESSSARIAAQRRLQDVLGWLWDVAAEPVLDALGYRQPPAPGAAWPRVWWAPGGMLSLLPIHAAGSSGAIVMDLVASSYTPTIRALRYSRQHARHAAPHDRALIVAMAATPDLPRGELPHVAAEAAQLRALLPDHVLLADADSAAGTRPTRANVFAHLPACSIAHFACHGESHPDDPSSSMLLLDDYRTAPLTVASLRSIRHDDLRLVYLSACRTAISSANNVLEESIHLATAFQLTGSRHVIGTLWEINDGIAAEIAGLFYRKLHTDQGTLDVDRAPLALHDTIRAIRSAYPGAPSLWAAYLHAGA